VVCGRKDRWKLAISKSSRCSQRSKQKNNERTNQSATPCCGLYSMPTEKYPPRTVTSVNNFNWESSAPTFSVRVGQFKVQSVLIQCNNQQSLSPRVLSFNTGWIVRIGKTEKGESCVDPGVLPIWTIRVGRLDSWMDKNLSPWRTPQCPKVKCSPWWTKKH
jgi:hypothetical protein